MDGYDLGAIARSAPADGETLDELFAHSQFSRDVPDEVRFQKQIDPAPPVSAGHLEAAWMPREATLPTEKRAFHGLAGPEAFHVSPGEVAHGYQ